MRVVINGKVFSKYNYKYKWTLKDWDDLKCQTCKLWERIDMCKDKNSKKYKGLIKREHLYNMVQVSLRDLLATRIEQRINRFMGVVELRNM